MEIRGLGRWYLKKLYENFNARNPSTNELTMNFVGRNNQELISALTSSLWSASWYFSAKLFQLLREKDYEYYKIFFITAFFYFLGTIFYSMIILSFDKNKAIEISEKKQILNLDSLE